MARVVPIIVAVALIIYAFIDCARTDSSRMPARITKPLWLLFIAIVPVVGALIWLFFKYQHIFKDDYPAMGSAPMPPFGRSRKPTGPVAPDDDPEFLARLEARNRRRAYEKRQREEGLLPDEEDKTDGEDSTEGGLYGPR